MSQLSTHCLALTLILTLHGPTVGPILAETRSFNPATPDLKVHVLLYNYASVTPEQLQKAQERGQHHFPEGRGGSRVDREHGATERIWRSHPGGDGSDPPDPAAAPSHPGQPKRLGRGSALPVEEGRVHRECVFQPCEGAHGSNWNLSAPGPRSCDGTRAGTPAAGFKLSFQLGTYAGGVEHPGHATCCQG